MACSELGIPEAEWETTLNAFRAYYEAADDSHELQSVPLIAHHDDTIRFTNSTTSVMKRILLNDGYPGDRTYLVQPAMGTQGIVAWERDGRLGPYPSYFHSMGSVYPIEMSVQAVREMVEVAEQIGFELSSLFYMVSAADTEIIDTLKRAEVQHQVDESSRIGAYRHSYGNDRLAGRNANVFTRRADGSAHSLGNLTCIERDGNPVAWEVSYDSTHVIARLNQLDHPIDAFTHQLQIPEIIERRVASDAAMVTSVLLHEGLQPRSKGKNGMLRKFMRTYVELGIKVSEPEELVDMLGRIAMTELALREVATSPLSDEYNHVDAVSESEVKTWIRKLI